MSVQGAMVDEDALRHFQPTENTAQQSPAADSAVANDLEAEVASLLDRLRTAERPLLWLGVGVRMAEAVDDAARLVDQWGIPVLLSWSAIDLLPSEHALVMGRAGVYGQRAANFILQSCDSLVAVGTRLSILQVGYDVSELARDAADITVVDIDPTELQKYPQRFNHPVCADAGDFVREALRQTASGALPSYQPWLKWCSKVRERFPAIGPEHDDKPGYINSYRFMERLKKHLKPDQVIVTDMGTALLSGHEALQITPPQRLLTSQGLGEMGFGLPGAIGASFARDGGEVLCLNCDGGIMMNLQELQTVAHFQLPIKIVVFNNDGYLMIKHTQKAILKSRYSGTNRASGVSCPDFSKLATAFGFRSFQVRTWEDFDSQIPLMQQHEGPVICEVFMDPEQYFHPKLGVAVQADGTLISPPLEDLSPFLDREVLRENLKVPLHPKSELINAK